MSKAIWGQSWEALYIDTGTGCDWAWKKPFSHCLIKISCKSYFTGYKIFISWRWNVKR